MFTKWCSSLYESTQWNLQYRHSEIRTHTHPLNKGLTSRAQMCCAIMHSKMADSPYFRRTAPISEGQSLFQKDSPYFRRTVPISEGQSLFQKDSPYFRRTVPISEGQSLFQKDSPYFRRTVSIKRTFPISEGQSGTISEGQSLLKGHSLFKEDSPYFVGLSLPKF